MPEKTICSDFRFLISFFALIKFYSSTKYVVIKDGSVSKATKRML